MDGAAAAGYFTGKYEDAWTRDKRELVNILVFGEIFLQIALKYVDTEKKGEEGEMKTLKQTYNRFRLEFVSLISLVV